MTADEYYTSLSFAPLNTLLDKYPKEKIESLLSTFKCEKNTDLEDFLTQSGKAILSEQRAITRTYLYLEVKNGQPIVVAYFTITLKILDTDGLSGNLIKKLDGVDKNREHIPCYLIAQLGKNTLCSHKIGQNILDDAIKTIRESYDVIGGRFIILDAVNVQKVIKFYQNEPNAFVLLDRSSTTANVKMYYPII